MYVGIEKRIGNLDSALVDEVGDDASRLLVVNILNSQVSAYTVQW
jgi:hypothetical protein